MRESRKKRYEDESASREKKNVKGNKICSFRIKARITVFPFPFNLFDDLVVVLLEAKLLFTLGELCV